MQLEQRKSEVKRDTIPIDHHDFDLPMFRDVSAEHIQNNAATVAASDGGTDARAISADKPARTTD